MGGLKINDYGGACPSMLARCYIVFGLLCHHANVDEHWGNPIFVTNLVPVITCEGLSILCRQCNR